MVALRRLFALIGALLLVSGLLAPVAGAQTDDTPPRGSFTAPAPNATVPVGSVTLEGEASDDVGVDRVEVGVRNRDTSEWLQDDGTFGPGFNRVDADLADPGATATDWTLDAQLAEGLYVATAKVRDAANNSARTPTRRFKVGPGDSAAPSVSIDEPAEGETVTAGTVDISGTAGDDTGVKRVSVWVKNKATKEFLQDDGTFAPGFNRVNADLSAPGATATEWTVTAPIPEGRYRVNARAVDNVNKARGVIANFEAADGGGDDTTDPTITITAPANGSDLSSPVTVEGTASDDTGVADVVVVIRDTNSKDYLQADGSFGPQRTELPADLGSPGATTTDYSFTIDLPDGRYRAIVRSADAAGNRSPNTNTDFTVTTPAGGTAPTVDPIADLSVAEGGSDSVAVTTTEADGDPVALTLSSSPDASAFVALTDSGDGTGTIDIAPRAGDAGTYTVTVTATDADGSDDETFTLTVDPAPAPELGATVTVTGNGGLGASTFSGGAFEITNGTDGAAQITSVTVDLSTAVFPDIVFDPNGTAGDEAGKCFIANSGAAATGLSSPNGSADGCDSPPFTSPHDGDAADGYDGLLIEFDDFDSGETFTFSVDIDPTSIKNQTGTGSAGSVSGFELAGATVTVTFDTDDTLTGQLFGDGSQGGSALLVPAPAGPAPALGVQGVNLAPALGTGIHDAAQVTEAAQTITVDGPDGADVTLVAIDAALLATPGYDIEPFEANENQGATYTPVTLTGGTASVPVTLVDGLNYFIATVDDGTATGPTSNVVVLELVDAPGDVAATLTANAGAGIGASTYGNGSFVLTNDTDGAAQITSVTVDLSTAVFPDIVFDPNGTAGDDLGKCFIANSGAAETGLSSPNGSADGCDSPPFTSPHDGDAADGYDGLLIEFDDFDSGETFTFSVDIDPTSIKNQTGTGSAGSVSGFELAGATVTVTFDTGDTVVGQLFGDGSQGGGLVLVPALAGPAPTLGVQGVTLAPALGTGIHDAAQVTEAAQTITVDGPDGADVTLVAIDAALLATPGYDIEPFEANENQGATFTPVTLTGGTASVPVTLVDGLNYFIATVDDGTATGPTSNVVVLELVEAGTPPTVDAIGDLAVEEGSSDSVEVTTSEADGDPVTLTIASTPDASGFVTLTDDGDGTGTIDIVPEAGDAGSYDITVTASDADGSDDETFTLTVTEPGDGPTVVLRVNAGGPEVAATDGGPAWSEDQAAAGGDAGGPADPGTPSPFFAAGEDKTYGTNDAVDVSDPSVPAGTPSELFQTERYDPAGGEELLYELPVASGVAYEVDLYFAEIFQTTDGSRVFDVTVEGETPPALDDLDVHARVGHDAGLVITLTTPVIGDDFISLEFLHQTENPKVNAIEVRTAGPPPSDVPPTVTAIDDQTVTEGDDLTVDVGTTEPDGDPVTLTIASTPDASGFVTLTDDGDGTGTIDIAPQAGDAGSYDITVTATDADGSDDETFTLTVDEAAAPGGSVLYRVNTGGEQVAADPSDPDQTPWSADTAANPSPFVTDAAPKFSTHPSANASEGNVPDTVPDVLFTKERWDQTNPSDMTYSFPVPDGQLVEVRTYHRNGFSGTSQAGQRVFDVVVEGTVVADDVDLAGDYGHLVPHVFTTQVTSDGSIEVSFGRETENPLVNAIEIVSVGGQPDTLGAAPTSVDFGTVVVGSSTSQTVTVTNLGESGDPDVTVTDVGYTGDAAEFSDDLTGPIVLGPGESTSFDITFDPSATDPYAATATVEHSGTNTVEVSLQGSGASSIPVGFSKQTVVSGLGNPTSIQWGPDDRLYVSQQSGEIQIYSVTRDDGGDYDATLDETILDVKQIQNHDDAGIPKSASNRQVTGLVVGGTAANPVLYVSSSDPRIAKANDNGQTDTNSGIISRLTWNGSSWDHLELVRGLPRSEENHSTNGLVLDGDTLFAAQGGHTNTGAPSTNFGDTPEYALSTAILTVDLSDPAIGTDTYDLPTLDDPSRPNVAPGVDDNDPFGGNDGDNQAVIDPAGPVQIWSGGWRNHYDIVMTTGGRLYTIDNGPNGGWGGTPINNCSNDFNDGGSTYKDNLHLVPEGYYGGHPNPTRGNFDNTFAGGQHPVPQSEIDPRECDYLIPGSGDGAIAIFDQSTNGMTEYTASNFGGAMQGDLLAASFDDTIKRIELNAAGDALAAPVSNVGTGIGNALDVTALGDDGPFPGTIWVAAHGANNVIVLEPNDFGSGGGSCSGADDAGLDEDDDGFDNADEIDNGTDPCSSASVPPDFDGDGTSNLNDADDDNDGTDDVDDVLPVDPDDGMGNTLPFELTLSPSSVPGTIEDLGFTGLMTNLGVGQDYLALYDPNGIVAGGAAGVLGVDGITDGDAFANQNDQEYAFQVGVEPGTAPFTVHSRINGPWPAGVTPTDFQSVGIFVGTGTQSDYIKLVAGHNDGTGFQLAKEVGDSFSSVAFPQVPLQGVAVIDLYLHVDPATGLVTASYSLDQGATVVPISGSTTIPAGWLDPTLVVGLISTSNGPADPIPASWDFIEVTEDAPPVADTSASLAITEGGGINASTFGAGSFEVTNTGTTDIDSVRIDLSTAMLDDIVFDPDGTAGDQTSKGFTPSDVADVTVDGFSYEAPHNGVDNGEGYDALVVDLSGFAPGESFSFAIDTDPTSITGAAAPGPGDSGSVSGLEMTGAMMTVTSGGDSVSGTVFAVDGSTGGGSASAEAAPAGAPGIGIAGVDGPTTLDQDTVDVTVDAPQGSTVRLLAVEAGAFTRQGGQVFNVDPDPYEANSVVAVDQRSAVAGPGDTATFTGVPLARSTAQGGLNHYVAVVEDADGDTGATSEVLVVERRPVVRINAGGGAIAQGLWAADAGFNTGQSYSQAPTITFDPTVPNVTPQSVFHTERFDPASGPELSYSIPLVDGTYEVRLYFAEIFLGGPGPNNGFRQFDVSMEGSLVLDDYVAYDDPSDADVGRVEAATVTVSGGNLEIDFAHVSGGDNPSIKGIEVVPAP